jgi:hypothetical protein
MLLSFRSLRAVAGLAGSQGPFPLRWRGVGVGGRCNSTATGQGPGGAEGQGQGTHTRSETSVQWLFFAGFYQKSIVKDFIHSASQYGVTGFLAHGKPAIACVEGPSEAIQGFIRHVRTTVFATVPRASRKMTVGLREAAEADSPSPAGSRPPRFQDFQAKEFFSQGSHHRSDMLDRKQLDAFLKAHGVPEDVRRRIGDPALG